MSLTSDFSPSGVSRLMQLKVATPLRRATIARVDADLLEAFDGEGSVRIVADTAEHADPRAEARKRRRDVSGHAARRLLLDDAVHLAVPGRQAIDLDHDVDVEVADTEEQGQLLGGLLAALKPRSSRRQ